MPYKDPAKRRAATKAWRDQPDHKQKDRIRKRIERRLKPKSVSLDPSLGSGKVKSPHERQVIEFFKRVKAEDPERFKEVFDRYPALTARQLKSREEREVGEDGTPATVSEAERLRARGPEDWVRGSRGLSSQHGITEEGATDDDGYYEDYDEEPDE